MEPSQAGSGEGQSISLAAGHVSCPQLHLGPMGRLGAGVLAAQGLGPPLVRGGLVGAQTLSSHGPAAAASGANTPTPFLPERVQGITGPRVRCPDAALRKPRAPPRALTAPSVLPPPGPVPQLHGVLLVRDAQREARQRHRRGPQDAPLSR